MTLQYVKKGERAKPLSRQPSITFAGAQATVRKAGDVAGLVVNGTESFPEDTFAGAYSSNGTAPGDISIIEPFIKPGTLKALVTQNNTLNQCVEVMEVNIDGTGHTIEKVKEDGPDDEAEKQMLTDFFHEPYPGLSMVGIRRDLRRDLEDTGLGYLEVGCSIKGDPVTLSWLEADSMRLIRLDDPIWVEKPLTRGGKEIMVKVRVRERRFVQIVNGKRTYFKEFGASRDLNRFTGQWAQNGEVIRPEMRASEVMYFMVNKEPRTPYGTPRWINQLPSVLGSRKAEEHNLDFFDAGGLPPVLILVQGGYLGKGVGDDLRAHLGGKGAKHRAAIVEAMSASGSLDSAGSVKVTVERFGAERQQDGMFQNYDTRCGDHVRMAFRLPPMFFGQSADYNFATAMTAYMTVEAQVFAPERLEFDNKMNQLARRLGAKNYYFKSKPITLNDAATQMLGINNALTAKVVTPESAVKAINSLTNLHLESQEPPATDPLALQDKKTQGAIDLQDNAHANSQVAADEAVKRNIALQKQVPGATGAGAQPKQGDSTQQAGQPTNQNPNAKPTKAKLQVVKSGEGAVEVAPSNDSHSLDTDLISLAESYASVLGISGFDFGFEGDVDAVLGRVNKLDGEERKFFNSLLASRSLVGVKPELGALGALCGCAADLMESEVESEAEAA